MRAHLAPLLCFLGAFYPGYRVCYFAPHGNAMVAIPAYHARKYDCPRLDDPQSAGALDV